MNPIDESQFSLTSFGQLIGNTVVTHYQTKAPLYGENNIKNIMIIIILCMLIVAPMNARWVQTKGLHKKEIHSLIFYKIFLFAGTFQNGIYRSTDNGIVWVSLNSELTDKYIFSFAANNSFLFACTNTGIYRSSNYGNSWTTIGPTIDETVSLGVNGSSLFANGSYGDNEAIFHSTDNGNSWTMSLPINIGIGAFAVHENNIYAAGRAGDIYEFYHSTDNGLSWATGKISKQINSIAILGSAIIAAGIGGVLRSTDNGTTWSDAGLKNYTIVALAVMGTNLFAAGGDDTGCQILRSTDNGRTWKDTGLEDILVSALTVKENILFAGTGFGIYVHRY